MALEGLIERVLIPELSTFIVVQVADGLLVLVMAFDLLFASDGRRSSQL